MSQARDPGRPQRDRDPAGAGRQPVRQPTATRVFFEPGTYGSAADPLVFQVGYYTQVAGLGAHAAGHGHQRRHRGVQQPVQRPAPDLQRRRQLLAVAVQPDPQRGPADHAAGLRAAAGRPRRRRLRPTARRCGRPPRPRRSGGPSSTAASSSRTTARPTTSPAAASSPTARSPATSTSTATSSTWSATAPSAAPPAARTGCGTWSTPASKGAPAPVFTGQCQQNTVLRREPGHRGGAVPLPGRERRATASSCPRSQTNSSGPSWAERQRGGLVPAAVVVLRRVNPATPVAAINVALAVGEEPRADARRLQPVRSRSWSAGRTRWCSARASPRWSRSTATPP